MSKGLAVDVRSAVARLCAARTDADLVRGVSPGPELQGPAGHANYRAVLRALDDLYLTLTEQEADSVEVLNKS